MGLIIAVVGVVASVFPDWFGPLTGAPTEDVFEAVERRVRGGMVLGVGMILIGVTTLRPWSTSIPTAILLFVTGALAMRILGIVIDGGVPKQWMWVALEVLVIVVAGAWLWWRGRSAP
ncbi:MAG: hypothetical protein AAF602_30015 [Myxococcota bacterium]